MIPDSWKEYLDGWRKLTEAESRAITGQDWVSLEQTQKAKLQLRIEFGEFLDEAMKPSSDPGLKGAAVASNVEPQPAWVRETVQALILAEQQNALALGVALERMRARMDKADSTRRNLRQVQRAYSTSNNNMHHWQFYS